MNTTTILTEKLTEKLHTFINELRLANFNIGMTQFIVAQNLILSLAKQGKLPPQLAQLKTLLAPVLCHSPKEQQEFEWRFNNWLKKVESPEEISRAEVVTLETQPPPKIRPTKKWALMVVFAAAILIVMVMGIIFYPFYPFTPTGQETPPTITPSDLTETPPQLPDITPALPDTSPALPAQPPELPKEISEPPTPVSTLWTILLLLPLATLLLWYFWNIGRRFLARRYLTRKFTSLQPDIQKLFVKAKELEPAIFQPFNLSHTAQQLRKHVPMPANRLDIVATLDKTIEAGGWLTPVYGTTVRRPEYLVLVDRTTFKDHQAALVNTLINQLVAEGVLVTRYYFEGNPRRCYPEPEPLEPEHLVPATLTELADRYPTHRLMIFSDGSGFINPVTGELVRWIEQFAVWSPRFLFILEAPEQWSYRKQLEAADFLVLPLNEAGLKFLVEWVNAKIWQSYPEPSESVSGDFPKYLRDYPRRWLEHHPPEPADIVELLRQVQLFLGKDGYYWFSACAVYPELHWQLTLYLGNQLTSEDSQKLLRGENLDEDETEEKILVKLARLPWFRYGYMPDWLRERVIADLVPHKYMPNWLRERLVADLVAHKQYKEIYAALNALIPAEKSSEHFEQPVATGQPKPFTEESPLTEPLNEHVFVTFMADKLAFQLPEPLRGLVVGLSNRFKAISMRTVGAVIAVSLLVAILGLTLVGRNDFEEQQRLAEQAFEEKRQAEQARLAREEAKLKAEQARLAKIEAQLKAEQERLAKAAAAKRRAAELARLEAEAKRQAELKKKQAMASLLQDCQKHLKANRLTTGRAGTAFDCYQTVLKREPNNKHAKAGLAQIEQRYREWIANAQADNQLAKVDNYLERLRKVNPHSEIFAEIESQRQAEQERLAQEAEAAKRQQAEPERLAQEAEDAKRQAEQEQLAQEAEAAKRQAEQEQLTALSANSQCGLPGTKNTTDVPIALVIGNSAYQTGRLKHPVNDAVALTKVLREIGFSVILRTNLNAREMDKATYEFSQCLQTRKNVGWFYFSGHGAQVDGKNYLLPVNNANIRNKYDVEFKTFPVLKLLARLMDAKNDLNIIILDASRDNPYSRFDGHGLTGVSTPTGFLIAFPTEPSKTVQSAQQDENSLYIKILIKALKTAAQNQERIEDVFLQVADAVKQESQGQQVPWYNASLKERFCFGGCKTPLPRN